MWIETSSENDTNLYDDKAPSISKGYGTSFYLQIGKAKKIPERRGTGRWSEWGWQVVVAGSRHSRMELYCCEMVNSVPTAIYDKAIFGDPRVLTNLLFLEPNYTPRVCFGTVQHLVEPYMRKIITTWMLEVCEEHGCEEQVFPLAVNFLDRFLAVCPIKPNQLQLSATVSLLLASKVRMCTPLSVHMLSRFTDRSITSKQIKDWELLFLSKLQWEVCGVTGFDFIDHLLEGANLAGSCNMLRAHAITLLALAYTEADVACIRGSILACAALVSAARGLRMKPDVLNDVCTLIKCDPRDVESIVARIEVILAECAVHQTYSDSNSLCL